MSDGAITAADLRAWLLLAADEVAAARERLTDLDAAIGDADHGVNLDRGFKAVRAAVQDGESDPAQLLVKAGRTLISTVGGASGPLWKRVACDGQVPRFGRRHRSRGGATRGTGRDPTAR